MTLEPRTIGTQDELLELVGELAGWRQSGELKLLSGNFSLGAIVHATFEVKATGERWELHVLNDGAHGGGALRRIG